MRAIWDRKRAAAAAANGPKPPPTQTPTSDGNWPVVPMDKFEHLVIKLLQMRAKLLDAHAAKEGTVALGFCGEAIEIALKSVL